MEETLLDDISTIKEIITDTWANGSLGKIVDIKNDGNFRFVDYRIGEDGLLKKCHLREADEMTCPIVATGFVGYWLHNRKLGIRDLFASYYNNSMSKYEKAHQYDVDSWERDLKQEFACRKHVPAERKAIETSKAILPFLSHSDVQLIDRLTTNYLAYARKKRKELYPPNYPKNEQIERTFIQPFSFGGTAYDCTNWMRTEYDLPIMRPHSEDHIPEKERLEGKWKDYHEVESRILIKDDFDDFDETVLTYMDGGMMEEIHTNLKNCATYEDKLRYITSLIVPFKEFADAFCPKERIDNQKKRILEDEEDIRYWESYKGDLVDPNTGKPINPQEELDACKESIEDLKKDIEYWEKVQDKFYWFAQHGLTKEFSEGEDHEMCQILGRWWSLMIFFARQLAALALTYKINLTDVQERCGVYLLWHMDITDYVDEHYITSYEYAQKLLDEIEAAKPKPQKTSPKVTTEMPKEEPKEETTKNNMKTDFELLKEHQDNKDLDYYLAESHWNWHINTLLYKNLLVFYDGKELGDFLSTERNNTSSTVPDYTHFYGCIFNEAYRICREVLTTPVPETKVARFVGEASTWKFRGLKNEDGSPQLLQPFSTDMIEAYHIIGMANVILTLSNSQSASVDRFLLSLSVYKDKGMYFCGYNHCFEPYNDVYQGFICATILDGTNLRPSFDYEGRHDHLYAHAPWYKSLVDEIYERKKADEEKRKEQEQKSSSSKAKGSSSNQTHVHFEVNNVENGGQGIVINNIYNYPDGQSSHHEKSEKKTDRSKKTKNTPVATSESEKQHGVDYPVFAKGPGVTEDHIKAMYRILTSRSWISTQTTQAEFLRLFSGVSNSCEIIWLGQDKQGSNRPTQLGIAALYVLFKKLIEEKLISTSNKGSVGPVLESHFVDSTNHYLTSVSNSTNASKKANEVIELIIITLKTQPNAEIVQKLLKEDMQEKIDKSYV